MKSLIRILTLGAAGAAMLSVTNAHAFTMIQNTGAGRTSSGARVTCDDAGGFVHWMTPSIAWRLNAANQGAGAAAAVQNAMAAWTNVTPATYTLTYAGTTSAGFATDGTNTLTWANGNGCTGGCLALTALVLVAGQVIAETDVTFNNAVSWNTNGTDYDIQSVATHELGHTLGIHHTDVQKVRNRPTMYATYFGTGMRSLEADDMDALNCSYTRYPPPGANLVAGVATASNTRGAEPGVTLAARPRVGGSILRFAIENAGQVQLSVFDVAGRKVATLIDGFKPAGEHEIAWDGRSDSGRAASGFYFARIITPEGTASATVPLAE